VAEEELEISPMAGMSAPNVEREPPAIVTDDVLTLLLKARSGKTLTDRRDTAILRVFLDTGCRLSEVTNLRQGDVDGALQTIVVRGKGNRVRVVSLADKTVAAMDKYLRQMEREWPERVGPKEWLWLGRQGRMTTSGITNVLHRQCDDAGVPRLRWHQLRHTAAHVWLASGAAEGDLMQNMGWRSRTMLETYARSDQAERAREAARRLQLGDRV
jgi:integrase/recombinase XerC